LARAKLASGRVGEAVLLRDQALADLAGIVDPAADTLRAKLSELTGDIAPSM